MIDAYFPFPLSDSLTEEQTAAVEAIADAMQGPLPVLFDRIADAMELWPEHAGKAKELREARFDSDRAMKILDMEAAA